MALWWLTLVTQLSGTAEVKPAAVDCSGSLLGLRHSIYSAFPVADLQ